MQTLRFVLTDANKSFCFEKDFSLSCSTPVAGWWVSFSNGRGGYVSAIVRWIDLHTDENVVVVYCDTRLEELWDLHNSKTGWKTNDPQVFCNNPDVIKKVKERDARMANTRAEIAAAEKRAIMVKRAQLAQAKADIDEGERIEQAIIDKASD